MRILREKHRVWVLYDVDGMHFTCGLFALLLCGREVLVPSGGHENAIRSLLRPGVGLIGNHPTINSVIRITSDEISLAAPSANLVFNGRWGQVAFRTSGSSGKPKFVVKTAQQLHQEAVLLQRQWNFSATTTFVPLVTHMHMYGLAVSLLLPLVCGASFYAPRFEGMWAATAPLDIDCLHHAHNLAVVASPTVGRSCVEISTLAEPGSLVHARPFPVSRVYSAGGKLTPKNAEKLAKLFGGTVTEIFGSTETGAVAIREHADESNQHDAHAWRLLPELKAVAFDGTADKIQKVGVAGELMVWGGHVGGSKESPVATGDEVLFLDDGRFQLLGRNTQVYKIEGKRVSLDEVVEFAELCDFVEEAIVLPHKKSSRELLLCGVRLSESGKLHYQKHGKFKTNQVIQKHLLTFLPTTLVPRTIRYLDEIPRNPQGKLAKDTLIELLVAPKLSEFPLLGDARVDENRVSLDLTIPSALIYLQGHFDREPIVPGVVLLHWVYYYSLEHLSRRLDPMRVNRVKFFKPIHPNDQITLILTRLPGGVEFTYLDSFGNKMASGII